MSRILSGFATAAMLALAGGNAFAQSTAPGAGGSTPPAAPMGPPGANTRDYGSVVTDRDRNGTWSGDETAERLARENRDGGKAIPASPADIVAGLQVSDTNGVLIGTVDSVGADGAVILYGSQRARIPLHAFGKNKNGLLLGITKAQFEAAVASATKG
jgi:hypothetical protein